MPQYHDSAPPTVIRFVRHGATAPNLAGLRCGGDADPPLTALGREQVELAARLLAAECLVESGVPAPGLVIASGLQRTRETALILARALGDLPVLVMPAWAERALGAWNGQTIASTEAALQAGQTPPGGESNADFTRRIHGAVLALVPHLPQHPLLVGSKGVARVLGELCGMTQRVAMDNGRLGRFDLSAVVRREPFVEA